MIPLIDAAPYDALGTLAGFSAAISIAYAGLPNFRHREAIQQYVRDKVKTNALSDILSTDDTLRDHECWCVLYRLGNLRDTSAPEPRIEADKNFQRWNEFKAFNLIYGTNLDKLITIALGALSGSVIWFGLLDRTHFPTPKMPDYTREWMLATFIGFYEVFFILGMISIALHIFLFSKSIGPDKWFNKVPYWANCAIVALFVYFISISILGIHPLGEFGAWTLGFVANEPFDIPVPTAVFALSRILLLATALVPLYFLWRGTQLTRSMTEEVNRCVAVLGANAVDAAANTTINPAE